MLSTPAEPRTTLLTEAEAEIDGRASPGTLPFPELPNCDWLLQQAGFVLPVAAWTRSADAIARAAGIRSGAVSIATTRDAMPARHGYIQALMVQSPAETQRPGRGVVIFTSSASRALLPVTKNGRKRQ